MAEPEPDSQLTVDDDQLVSDMLATIVETGQPDLALRAIRMFGDGARRAADGALGVYREAVDRTGDDLRACRRKLPSDVCCSVARFARQSPGIAVGRVSTGASDRRVQRERK